MRDRAFLGTAILLFIASAGITIHTCMSMSHGMVMAGGWTMSMTWMRMPGQSWSGAASSFMGMWIVMMAAMMLPSLAPGLLSFRSALRGLDAFRLAWLTALAGAGYFFVWALLGAAIYPLGVLVARAEMGSAAVARSMPIAAVLVLLLAGCFQLTPWKAHRLCLGRPAPAGRAPAWGPDGAWHHGVRLGADCALCCFGWTAVLLVSGVMDLGAMALVTTAITAERILPQPERVARASGMIVIAAGVFLGAERVFQAVAGGL